MTGNDTDMRLVAFCVISYWNNIASCSSDYIERTFAEITKTTVRHDSK